MADIEIFGLQPGMHHLMNILLHSMNAFLLFSVLWWMTRAFWQSLLVASLFALHPMNVDTVAWIAERKNILSLFFCLTTLLAYTYYTRKPGFSRYMLVMLTFLCALMSKPMVVTLPILLLMLDYWPLKRFQNLRNEEGGALLSKRRFKKSVLLLVAEKMPLIFLSILSTGMTLSSLTFYQDIIPLETRPLGARISHSLIAYVIYLLKTFVPVNLAIHHPYPVYEPFWQKAGAMLLLAGITLLSLIKIKKYPFLSTGWIWYLVLLLPASGIVQGGLWPSYAERWAYLPLIGVFIMVSWGTPHVMRTFNLSKSFTATIALIILFFLGTLSWIQTGYWKNSLILFSHAVDATDNNYLMLNNLGKEYEDRLKLEDAAHLYAEAVRLVPNYAGYRCNLANAYARLGKYDEAMKQYSIALHMSPYDAKVYLQLGHTLYLRKDYSGAIENYKRAIALDAGQVSAYYEMANAFMRLNRPDDALVQLRKAVSLKPDYVDARCHLGNVLVCLGRYDEAIQQYTETIRIDPFCKLARDNREKVLMLKKKVDR
jgi:Tfp pilus assembly protein PilF